MKLKVQKHNDVKQWMNNYQHKSAVCIIYKIILILLQILFMIYLLLVMLPYVDINKR